MTIEEDVSGLNFGSFKFSSFGDYPDVVIGLVSFFFVDLLLTFLVGALI